MNKTLIALAAATTVSLGAIGAASAASTSALDVTAQNGAAIQKVGYRHGFGYRPSYGYGYEYCKHLYYKGWVLDFHWARAKYYRYCTYRYKY